MKINLLLISILLMTNLNLTAQKGAFELVTAERKFEKDCREKGVKTGFLLNLDDKAISFAEGRPVKSKEYWMNVPEIKLVFAWTPSYVEPSISGNWGYTTGNYEYFSNDTLVGYGQYTTVWHKNNNGEWKYLLDIGNDHGHVSLNKKPKFIKSEKFPSRFTEDSIMNLEKKYIERYHQEPGKSFLNNVSENYLLNLNGNNLIEGVKEASGLISLEYPEKYIPEGVMISDSKDMAVVYGTFTINGKTDSYIRIWRNEKKGWKIALEVIRI